ncbi:hypothetical protein [Jatrophihabitans sp.]|uniref:hypothetical protein n=1 Tax=Jatrophihabitans sp. TaxID=1932789 RepID=UPI002EF6EDEE
MSGVWAKDRQDRWSPLIATGFISEGDLHELIEQTPAMLPLAGAPTIAIIGKEVVCGRERADLVGVEIETGRPVIIEVKLAANTDRRQALTQVLGYAAYLRRLDLEGLNVLLHGYLDKQGYASIAHAAHAAAQSDPSFDEQGFRSRLADALAHGRLRAVIVLDSAPADVIELVGYLQEVTSDRLALDLVVVTAYDVNGQRILVPQLVEPDRTQVTAQLAGTGKPSTAGEIRPGAADFAASIETAPPEQQPKLRRLLRWAQALEQDGVAKLYTSIGKGRWVLNPRLPGQTRGMVMVWNDNGAYLSPYRTVLAQLAPATLARLDAMVPGEIGQGNYIRTEFDDELLDSFRAAYMEAAAKVDQ